MSKGKTFIISGPSGVGKSTVLNALLKEYPDLYFSVSATTRDPREGEVDGIHYHFIAPEYFHQMIEEDAFLEYAEYVGNFYGTPKKYVDAAMEEGKDVILDIEIQGATQVHNLRPDVVRIFIAPPSWKELERRLTAHGQFQRQPHHQPRRHHTLHGAQRRISHRGRPAEGREHL